MTDRIIFDKHHQNYKYINFLISTVSKDGCGAITKIKVEASTEDNSQSKLVSTNGRQLSIVHIMEQLEPGLYDHYKIGPKILLLKCIETKEYPNYSHIIQRTNIFQEEYHLEKKQVTQALMTIDCFRHSKELFYLSTSSIDTLVNSLSGELLQMHVPENYSGVLFCNHKRTFSYVVMPFKNI